MLNKTIKWWNVLRGTEPEVDLMVLEDEVTLSDTPVFDGLAAERGIVWSV